MARDKNNQRLLDEDTELFESAMKDAGHSTYDDLNDDEKRKHDILKYAHDNDDYEYESIYVTKDDDSDDDDEDYQKALKKLQKKNDISKDKLANESGHKQGTKGYGFWSKLNQKVQEINSVSKLLKSAEWFDKIAYIALFPVFLIHLIGLMYDINYHVPSLREDFSIVGVGVLALFIVVVIMVFTHVTSDNLINKELKPVVKRTFTILFIFGVVSSFYFSWRAIVNYTKGVVISNQQTAIATGSNAQSVVANTISMQMTNNTNTAINLNNQIQANNKRLNNIPTEKSDLVKKKMETTEKLKTIQNGVTKRKYRNIAKAYKVEIDRLDKETSQLREDNDKLQAKIDDLTAKSMTLAKSQKKQLQAMQGGMDDEQFQREIFLFILVLFLEVASLGKVIAMFIQDRNISKNHHKDLHKIHSLTDTDTVIDNIYNNVVLDKLSQMHDKAEVNRATVGVINEYAMTSAKNQVATLSMMTESTNDVIQGTNRIAQQAVKGITDGLLYQGNKEVVKGLQSHVVMQGEMINKLMLELTTSQHKQVDVAVDSGFGVTDKSIIISTFINNDNEFVVCVNEDLVREKWEKGNGRVEIALLHKYILDKLNYRIEQAIKNKIVNIRVENENRETLYTQKLY